MIAYSSLIPRLNFARELGVNTRTLDNWTRGTLQGIPLEPVFRGTRIYYTWSAYHAWQRKVIAARNRLRLNPGKRPKGHKRKVVQALGRHRIEATEAGV